MNTSTVTETKTPTSTASLLSFISALRRKLAACPVHETRMEGRYCELCMLESLTETRTGKKVSMRTMRQIMEQGVEQ